MIYDNVSTLGRLGLLGHWMRPTEIPWWASPNL